MMWFATYNGLSYYDGYTFHTFRDLPDNQDVLSTNRIRNIFPAPTMTFGVLHTTVASTYIIPVCATL